MEDVKFMKDDLQSFENVKSFDTSLEEYEQMEEKYNIEVLKLIPPPLPLIAKKLYSYFEPLNSGLNTPILVLIYIRRLRKFANIETNKSNLYNKFDAINFQFNKDIESGNLILKSELERMYREYKLVYERIYPNSLPNSKRSDYFFTEVVSIKSLINKRARLDSELNCQMYLKNYKTQTNFHLFPNCVQINPYEKTLIFESRFESGNLCLAFKVN